MAYSPLIESDCVSYTVRPLQSSIILCISQSGCICIYCITPGKLYYNNTVYQSYLINNYHDVVCTIVQLKILTTAGFAVLILNRNISSAKWRALLLLVLGCVLVASPAYNQPVECIEETAATEVITEKLVENDIYSVDSTLQTVLGFGAILAMNAISGFSSIYFESMLKTGEKKVTIWERNFQLAFCSIWLLIAVLMYEISAGTQELVFLKGWTINTVLIALIQAGGGLLVAACLKYADSILKTLATSGSIVLSAILGNLLLGGQLDIFIGIGCVCTILAISNYTFE